MCRAPPVNFAVEEEEEEEEEEKEGGGAIISCLGDHISIFKKWDHYIFFSDLIHDLKRDILAFSHDLSRF